MGRLTNHRNRRILAKWALSDGDGSATAKYFLATRATVVSLKRIPRR